MTEGQRNVVTNMGFQSILELKIKEIPKDLGFYVLSKLVTTETPMVIRTPRGDIPVNEEAVHEVYGFPMGLTIIQRSRIGNSNNVDMIKHWKRHLKLDKVVPTDLVNIMKPRKASDYFFKLDFLVLMVSTLVQSMPNGYVYIRFLQSITKNSDFKKLNWCDFVVQAAKDCKNAWDPNKKNSKFVGPLTFLVLLFCDRVATEIERVRPVITNWKQEDLTEFEKKKDFGSCQLLHAWRETTSGKAYLLSALNSEKDIHFSGCGCPRVEEDNVEEEAVESVVKEVDCLIENLAIARDHAKRKLHEAIKCFGANEKIQSIKEKWNSTFSKQSFIIDNDLGYNEGFKGSGHGEEEQNNSKESGVDKSEKDVGAMGQGDDEPEQSFSIDNDLGYNEGFEGSGHGEVRGSVTEREEEQNNSKESGVDKSEKDVGAMGQGDDEPEHEVVNLGEGDCSNKKTEDTLQKGVNEDSKEKDVSTKHDLLQGAKSDEIKTYARKRKSESKEKDVFTKLCSLNQAGDVDGGAKSDEIKRNARKRKSECLRRSSRIRKPPNRYTPNKYSPPTEKRNKTTKSKTRGKKRKQDVPDDPFKHLTMKERKTVEDTLSSPDRNVVLVTHESSNIIITVKLLQCLKPEEWLNDELTNENRGYDYSLVRNWTSPEKLGYSLHSCEKAKYITDEFNDSSVASWAREFVTDHPKQENWYDCGMFMMKYADFYSRDIGLSFNQENGITDCKFYSFEDELKDCKCGGGFCRTVFRKEVKYWCCPKETDACGFFERMTSTWQPPCHSPFSPSGSASKSTFGQPSQPTPPQSSGSPANSNRLKSKNLLLLQALETYQSTTEELTNIIKKLGECELGDE
ncbi:hypothetical protein SSX86_007851 [Deinandra increscens subsp. villosa]|uniref:Ubiquitin-like protease family profile domain-containing protein n=1 Tax=Deinandra increscens subsp. villosa TaxID=3103831 RepID=A0AAP0H6H7_9ASTR